MDVDVVVCVKNQAKALERLLRQVTREIPFKNLIVIYGDSTDGTKAVSEKFADKVFSDGNRGLGAARNLGMVRATSEIVAMIDSDVIIGKDWFEQVLRQFQNPNTAAAMGTCVYGYGCKPLEAYWEYLRRTGQNNYGCQNTMFRRELILKVGNFDEAIKGAGEDYDLYLRLSRAGYRWVWVREASAYHPMSLTNYYKHLQWWAAGAPYIDEIVQQVRATSLFKWYRNELTTAIRSLWTGMKLSVFVDPTLSVYYPAMIATNTITHMKALKKLGAKGCNAA